MSNDPIPNSEFFRFDCARKYLEDVRAQFPGLTIQQIIEHWRKEESWGELKAFVQALAIIRAHDKKEYIRLKRKQHRATQPKQKTNVQPPQTPVVPVVTPQTPQQTFSQALKSTTMLVRPDSIVSKGFEKEYNGINWPHYENILKLYTLNQLVEGEYTAQQQKDQADLLRAIKFVGNKGRKRTSLSAEEVIQRQNGVYLNFGRSVIDALTDPDGIMSVVQLKELRAEILRADGYNAIQLQKVMDKSRQIVHMMQQRYKKEN